MSELTVLIRIALHILSGYLLNAGVPPQVVTLLTSDPQLVEMLSLALASVPSVISLVWWRVSKHMGWAT